MFDRLIDSTTPGAIQVVDEDDELGCYGGFICTIMAIKPLLLSMRGGSESTWKETHRKITRQNTTPTTKFEETETKKLLGDKETVTQAVIGPTPNRVSYRVTLM